MSELERLDRFLRTDPRDVGCAGALAVLHVCVDLIADDRDAAGRYPGVATHFAACGPAARTSPDCSPQPPVTSPAGDRHDREALAFDLYGTLVDPIALSGELLAGRSLAPA